MLVNSKLIWKACVSKEPYCNTHYFLLLIVTLLCWKPANYVHVSLPPTCVRTTHHNLYVQELCNNIQHRYTYYITVWLSLLRNCSLYNFYVVPYYSIFLILCQFLCGYSLEEAVHMYWVTVIILHRHIHIQCLNMMLVKVVVYSCTMLF